MAALYIIKSCTTSNWSVIALEGYQFQTSMYMRAPVNVSCLFWIVRLIQSLVWPWSSTLSPGRHGYTLFSFVPQNTQVLPWWRNWKSLHLKQVLLRWLFISLLSPFCLPVFFSLPGEKEVKNPSVVSTSLCKSFFFLFISLLPRTPHTPPYPTSSAQGLPRHFVI